jgi:hypothetical protein
VPPQALVGLSPTDFELLDSYFAIRHYALYTDPEWVRLEAISSAPELLGSAWLSPGEDALTVVLVNPAFVKVDARLRVEGFEPTDSVVVRTVFPGVERFAALGRLSAQGVLSIPARSVVTAALRR